MSESIIQSDERPVINLPSSLHLQWPALKDPLDYGLSWEALVNPGCDQMCRQTQADLRPYLVFLSATWILTKRTISDFKHIWWGLGKVDSVQTAQSHQMACKRQVSISNSGFQSAAFTISSDPSDSLSWQSSYKDSTAPSLRKLLEVFRPIENCVFLLGSRGTWHICLGVGERVLCAVFVVAAWWYNVYQPMEWRYHIVPISWHFCHMKILQHHQR